MVVTDGDRTNQAQGIPTPGERRKSKYDALAVDLAAASNLDVFINTYSLETELVNAGNEDLLKGIYLQLHPQSLNKWNLAIAESGDARAAKVQGLFDDIPKGDFAQLLAESIYKAQTFKVPDYLCTAIKAEGPNQSKELSSQP